MSDDEQQFSRASKLKSLTNAAKHGDASALKRLIVLGDQKNDWNENKLRIALQKASEVGNQAAVRLLLESGAKTDVTTRSGLTPLHRAAMNGHYAVVKDLLKRGANVDAKDALGRSSTWYAASRGRNEVLRLLLQGGANVNAVDNGGKSVLHNLAADTERQRRWDHVTISSLLCFKPDLGLIDNTGRTALHWAAVTGNVEFASLLLPKPRAIVLVSATTHRGKTALQLAAEHGHNPMVFLLLQYGANANAKSDGNWTPLLNAAKEGHKDVVDTLLRFSKPNARTSSGRTALHWAADQGHLGVVKRILMEPTSLKNSKDNSENTPFSLATQKGHHEIVEILKPYIHDHGPSDHAKHACENFTAAVVDFVRDPKEKKASPKVRRLSVYDVLYSPKRKPNSSKGEPAAPSNETTNNSFLITTNVKIVKADFRWIHLPANNVAWAEALVNKYFIEHGDRAIYESMLESLQDQQHRGPQAHSFYMRPIFEEVWRDAFPLPAQKKAKPEGMGHSWVSAAGEIDHSTASPQLTSGSPKNVFALFMPYLHWETDENRAWTSRTIQHIQNLPVSSSRPTTNQEESLLRGYLPVNKEYTGGGALGGLHIRRTLDQFHHQTVKTDNRDRDQVVLRHCARHKTKEKIFMVDQLWMWIVGDDLVFTCFPERVQQPENDPLNVFRGVIDDLNSTTRAVSSAFELAATITNRCMGTFARHQLGLQEYSFLEMIDMTIGTLTRRETALFERFQQDAAIVADQLANFGKLSRIFHDTYTSAPRPIAFDLENEEDEWLTDNSQEKPHIIDRLWNVAKEAKLIVECKDISGELGMLTAVFSQGQQVLRDMQGAFERISALGDETKASLSKSFAQQQRMVDSKLLDINRMDKAVKGVYDNLFEVLDLKQKHANSVEVRLSRDRAMEAAQQGRTIMVFTIVTIIFLPMSFLAAFFAINIVEFPYVSNGAGLHLSFVTRYIFGIGMAVSIPLIAMAYIFDKIQDWLSSFWRSFWSLGRARSEKSAPGDGEIRTSSESFNTRAQRSIKNEGLVTGRGLAREVSSESLIWRRPSRIGTRETVGSPWIPDVEAGMSRLRR